MSTLIQKPYSKGWSSLTAAAFATEQRIAEWETVKDQTKWSIYRAVDDGAHHLGLPKGAKELLLLLIKYTKNDDYKLGRTPFAWPSNIELAEQLNICVRQINTRINQCINCGFLLRQEGNAPRRNGARNKQTGEILWARGFDLRPTVEQYENLMDAKLRINAIIKHRKLIRREITTTWARLCQLNDYLIEMKVEGVQQQDMAELKGSVDMSRRTKNPEVLSSVKEILTISLGNAQSQAAAIRQKHAAYDAENFTCTTITNQLIHVSKDTIRNTEIAKEKEGSKEAMFENMTFAKKLEIAGSQQTITPSMLIKASPQLSALHTNIDDVSWYDLYQNARRLAKNMDVNESTLRDVERLLGAVRATIAIGIAAERRTEIQSVGAWLRGVCDAERDGRLNLTRSVYGLLQAANDRDRENNTASQKHAIAIGLPARKIIDRCDCDRTRRQLEIVLENQTVLQGSDANTYHIRCSDMHRTVEVLKILKMGWNLALAEANINILVETDHHDATELQIALIIAEKMDGLDYNTWFDSCRLSVQNDCLIIKLYSGFKKDWIMSNLRHHLERATCKMTLSGYRVDVITCK